MSEKIIGPVALTGIHSGGRTIGIYNDKNYYVDFGIPGEIVDINVTKRNKGFRTGSVSVIHQKSEHRITPFCKHFYQCGGCNWQHIRYSGQLELKRKILKNAFLKYEITAPEILQVLPSENERFYRNRMEYAFSCYSFSDEGRKVTKDVLGFHLPGKSGSVIDIDECFLMKEPARIICRMIKEFAQKNSLTFYDPLNKTGLLRSLVLRTSKENQTMAGIGFGEENHELQKKFLTWLLDHIPEITSLYYGFIEKPDQSLQNCNLKIFGNSQSFITEKIGSFEFRISPKSFFQPNTMQAKNIYDCVLEFAALTGKEFVYDLYTGTGTIACYIAGKAGKVTGIEGSAEAIKDAEENAMACNISNISFLTGDILETFRPEFVDRYDRPDIIILDPPRAGTLIEIKKTILYAHPQKIIYVSCNPVSLAFDLKQLCDGYCVKAIRAFDMFPQTHHVETVVCLERL